MTGNNSGLSGQGEQFAPQEDADYGIIPQNGLFVPILTNARLDQGSGFAQIGRSAEQMKDSGVFSDAEVKAQQLAFRVATSIKGFDRRTATERHVGEARQVRPRS